MLCCSVSLVLFAHNVGKVGWSADRLQGYRTQTSRQAKLLLAWDDRACMQERNQHRYDWEHTLAHVEALVSRKLPENRAESFGTDASAHRAEVPPVRCVTKAKPRPEWRRALETKGKDRGKHRPASCQLPGPSQQGPLVPQLARTHPSIRLNTRTTTADRCTRLGRQWNSFPRQSASCCTR